MPEVALAGNASVPCRVCHRPLRSQISRMQMVGPVCMRRIRTALRAMMERVQNGEAESEYTNAYAMSPDELRNLVIQDVERAYQANRRRNREPIQTVVQVESATRGVEHEEMTVTLLDYRHGEVLSASGSQYQVTHDSCTCPDYVNRRSRSPELAQEGCRHMRGFRAARDQVPAPRSRLRPQQPVDVPVEIAPVVHEENHRSFAQIDWTIEQEREEVLNAWRNNRGFDGTYMSRDDAAWQAIQTQAQEEWDYKYENVLGGTGNTFGVEIEMEFPNDQAKRRALQELYAAGLTSSSTQLGYHSHSGLPGKWKAERDGSLGSHGMEMVSPVLNDSPEHWQQLEKVTEICRRNGAVVSARCGGHVHVGIAPLDHRTYSWQRLARIGLGFERQFFRMGGANSEMYRMVRRPGTHRGTGYAKPLASSIRFGDSSDARTARQRIGNGTRYTMFNTQNVDGGRPAIEMRYPNGSLDARQIQAQVQVANAVVHQAAVIRNDSPNSEFTPRLSETNRHFRLSGLSLPGREEQNFREFLDVLGNPQDRLAATWLWMRGSATSNR